jgi:hypothetical protein
MELIGKLTVIGEEKTFNGGFTKREFVLTTEEQYPQTIQFELLKDKGSTHFRWATASKCFSIFVVVSGKANISTVLWLGKLRMRVLQRHKKLHLLAMLLKPLRLLSLPSTMR